MNTFTVLALFACPLLMTVYFWVLLKFLIWTGICSYEEIPTEKPLRQMPRT